MAIVTIKGRDILFKIAEDTDNLKSAFVSTTGSTTSVTCPAITVDANTYQYAIGRVLGKGDCTISSHTNLGVFTVATLDSAPVANDVFQWAWWTGNKMGDAIASMNEAIRYSWPFWYREKFSDATLTGTVAKAGTTALTGTSTLFLTELAVGDMVSVPGGGGTEVRQIATITSNTAATVTSAFANTASGQTGTLSSNITLAAGTYRYALPPSVDAVLAIGIQTGTEPVEWLDWGDETAPYWQMEGQRGAYYIRFNPRASRDGAIPDRYSTTLVLHYATREPELTDLTTATCQLPKDYFVVGSTAYSMRNLQTASRVDLVTANVAVPLLQEQARSAVTALGIGKRPPNRVLNPDANIPEYKFSQEPQEQGDNSIKVKRQARSQQ